LLGVLLDRNWELSGSTWLASEGKKSMQRTIPTIQARMIG